MKDKNSLVWQQVAYYAPFLSDENVEEAIRLIEARREESVPDDDVMYSTTPFIDAIDDEDDEYGDDVYESSIELYPYDENLTPEENEEERSKWETDELLYDLEYIVDSLQLSGMSLDAIHEFIDKRQTISRLAITEDYRIFLPEYNNMEIEMTALPKALYFLFLRYPEGIVLKELQDHYTELLNIYRQLRPNLDEEKRALTVSKLVNPFSNAIHENLARIRKAFVEKFDEHLSKNYIITGAPGEPYAIELNRRLVVWQD